MPYASGESPARTIEVVKASITLDPLPAYAVQGDTVTFTGKATINGDPLVGATVEIYRAGAKIAEGTTAADGSYSISWTVPYGLGCLTHSFDAYLPDYDVWSGGRAMAIAYETKLTITAPDRVPAGETFTVSGRLTYLASSPTDERPLSGRTVKVYYNGNLLGVATTDAEGNYSVSGSIGATGTYTLKAVFEGEGLMAPAVAVLGVEIPGEAVGLLTAAGQVLAVAVPIAATLGIIAVDQLSRR